MIENKYYTDKFFDSKENDTRSSALTILPLVNSIVQPKSVIDIGCGVGNWLKVWNEDLGVNDFLGIEGPYLSTSRLEVSKEFVRFQDLKDDFKVNRKFDLAMSLEVAEHLPASSAHHFVRSLTQLSDIILFSAAIVGQEGTYHINEQPPEYWAQIFKEFGYIPVDYLRDKLWGNDDVQWWYQQNVLLYVKQSEIEKWPELKEASTRTSESLLRIHPWIFYFKLNKLQKTSSVAGFIRTKLYPVKKYFKSKFK